MHHYILYVHTYVHHKVIYAYHLVVSTKNSFPINLKIGIPFWILLRCCNAFPWATSVSDGTFIKMLIRLKLWKLHNLGNTSTNIFQQWPAGNRNAIPLPGSSIYSKTSNLKKNQANMFISFLYLSSSSEFYWIPRHIHHL